MAAAKKPGAAGSELPIVRCATEADWEAWLTDQAAGAPGVWLQIARSVGDCL